jgi:phosphohistidine phosphatase
MDLILWRHADASPGTPDMSRELTAKGQRQAEKMAAWLSQHLPATIRIVVSPATRAVQTAEALGRNMKIVDAIGPGASAESVLSCVHWPTAKHPVLVVGHQPTLGQVASLLLFGTPSDLTIKKGAIAWLSNRVVEGEAHVILRAMISTEFL